MKRQASILLGIFMLCAFTYPLLSGAKIARADEPQVLRIANWGEYMAGDKAEGTPDLLKQFELDNNIRVEYSRFDTNEWIYNDMKMNKKGDSYGYDLICPSDYMIQKMAREGMLEKIDLSRVSGYQANVSPYMQQLFAAAEVDEYAVGYMWGTLGYVFNADKVVLSDTHSWTALWNIDYKGKSTLKDSIRDTYFLGLAYVQRNELNELADAYDRQTAAIEAMRALYGTEDAALIAAEYAYTEFLASYADALLEMLNDTSPEMVAKVEAVLKSVSGNIFGYEVDTGKDDMVTGKIDLNFAWSGDAAYIIEEGGESFSYSVPREGSNIWFDGWVMPKGANKELAYKFMDFISTPESAIENMEAIGYTSVIAGENNEIYDWMMDYYELQEDDFEDAVRVDLTYFFAGTDSAERVYVYMDSEMKGKAFSAQYPDINVINRCTVMRDFDDQSLALISDMWVRLRANVLPGWAIVAIIAGALAIVAAALLIVLKTRSGKRPPKSKKNWTVVKTEKPGSNGTA